METKINTIDRVISKNGLDDVCQIIHYTFYKEKTVGSGDDVKTYSSSYISAVSLNAADPENFKAYADITEKDVQGWLEAKISADKLAEIEAGLDANIAEKETPTKGSGKPWS